MRYRIENFIDEYLSKTSRNPPKNKRIRKTKKKNELNEKNNKLKIKLNIRRESLID